MCFVLKNAVFYSSFKYPCNKLPMLRLIFMIVRYFYLLTFCRTYKVISLRNNLNSTIHVIGHNVILRDHDMSFDGISQSVANLESVPGGHRIRYNQKYLCMQDGFDRIKVCDISQFDNHYTIWDVENSMNHISRLGINDYCISPEWIGGYGGHAIRYIQVKPCKRWDYYWNIHDIDYPIHAGHSILDSGYSTDYGMDGINIIDSDSLGYGYGNLHYLNNAGLGISSPSPALPTSSFILSNIHNALPIYERSYTNPFYNNYNYLL